MKACQECGAVFDETWWHHATDEQVLAGMRASCCIDVTADTPHSQILRLQRLFKQIELGNVQRAIARRDAEWEDRVRNERITLGMERLRQLQMKYR